MKYSFQIIEPTDTDWQLIESASDSTIFHTKKWNIYLERIGYTPFVVEVLRDNMKIGYFVGQKFWRGIKIVASPFEGLGTYTQGLAMLTVISLEERVDIYKSLADWVFSNNIASFFQVDDWQLREDSPIWDAEKVASNHELTMMQVRHEVRPTLYIDLKRPIDNLWAGLHYKSCKYCINKARKLGLEVNFVETFEDIPSFVNVHYNQLCEVCKRKGMKPKAGQGKNRMLALCESLFPDRVLMVTVEGSDENGQRQIMSSGIFCIDKGECSYWTGASYQRYQKYCPNELMVWEAIRALNERGAGDLNFCGMANYKLKFGTVYAFVPKLYFTKFEWVLRAKSFAKSLYYRSRKLLR